MSFWQPFFQLSKELPKRPLPQESDVNEDSFDLYTSDEGSDPDWGAKTTPKKSPKKKRRTDTKFPKKGPKVATKAEILSLATNEIPGCQSASERLADIDSAILGKIKKALALGIHEGTGEAEAKRAMRLATKLMAQHNVNQADILAAEEDSEKLKRAGQSTVTIRSTSGKRVLLHSWSSSVADAVQLFFDCKAYSESIDDRIDWVFYGLSEQTVAAAYAFEMVYNLVLVWSVQNKNAKGRTAKNNYCHGVGDGLYKMAQEDRKAEEARVINKERERLDNARKAEEEERRKEVERLEGPALQICEEDQAAVKKIKVKIEDVPNEDEMFKSADVTRVGEDSKAESYPDSDEDEDFSLPADRLEDVEIKADFSDRDFNLNQMLEDMEHDFKPVSEPVKLESVSTPRPSPGPIVDVKTEEDDNPWASSQQLTLFRGNASSIADNYLQEKKIKLTKGAAGRGPNIVNEQDMAAYRQGRSDAKNIDVKRKRIKEGQDDE